MNNDSENPDSASSGRFLETVRPLRDLESNWTVDLAKYLEEYLLKVCSGQISGNDDSIFSVNFAEAALLLQGSVQVYSRKVEYLYSLVLHALNFFSQKSQEEQATSGSHQTDASGSGAHTSKAEGDVSFWVSDDITVEAKSLLDSGINRAGLTSHFVKPPANLVVLEGEHIDVGGDAGELESYLLATTDLYRDFILLDPCDAVVVDNFIESKSGKGPSTSFRASDLASKSRKSFLSPCRQSGQKSSAQKKQDFNLNKAPSLDQGFGFNDHNNGCFSPLHDFCADENDGFEMGGGYSEHEGLDDDSVDAHDDPWEPLNPHEPGKLKVKPYKRVKANRKVVFNSKNHVSLASEFPLAKFNGPISTELTEVWEAKIAAREKGRKSESLYEKLRQLVVEGDTKTKGTSCNPENNTEDNEYDSDANPDHRPPDFDMPDYDFNDEDPQGQKKHEEPNACENIEELCKSHLDSLLSKLAEHEKQTESAARVSTWNLRIEKHLEEEDARPPFDIHKYGDVVLDKLSSEESDVSNNSLSFFDVVKAKEKHDVARTFSALLQLINNRDVDLVESCPNNDVTEKNRVRVRLLKKQRTKGIQLHSSSRKRAKSPFPKAKEKLKTKEKENNPVNNNQVSSSSYRLSVSKGINRCTPEGKRRRKARVGIAVVDFQFVG